MSSSIIVMLPIMVIRLAPTVLRRWAWLPQALTALGAAQPVRRALQALQAIQALQVQVPGPKGRRGNGAAPRT